MDYEKEYKDAVARMELCVRIGLKITPEYIFPELAESEDERIRKSLIEIVERFMADERKEKTLAWLEKMRTKYGN